MQEKFKEVQAAADGIICDLDGTLLNTIADIAAAIEPVLSSRGFPGHPVEDYKQFVGDGLKKTLIRALPEGHGLPDEAVDGLYGEMMRNYQASPYRHTVPYEGISRFLEEIISLGIPVAILSNKDHALTVEIVSHILPSFEFSWVQGLKAPYAGKPDPEAVLMIAGVMGCRPERTLFIGDSEVDYLTAQNAGMIPRLVTWGFRDANDMKKSIDESLMIDTPQELLQDVKVLLGR